ncbi:MAG: LysM peptidoglycan-binding domain-containing protein [Phycisphaerae bacterium]
MRTDVKIVVGVAVLATIAVGTYFVLARKNKNNVGGNEVVVNNPNNDLPTVSTGGGLDPLLGPVTTLPTITTGGGLDIIMPPTTNVAVNPGIPGLTPTTYPTYPTTRPTYTGYTPYTPTTRPVVVPTLPTYGNRPTIGTGLDTGSGEYTIVKGDTFSTIAKAKGLTIKAIQTANPGVDSSKLKIGQKIKLPAASISTSTTGTDPVVTPTLTGTSTTTRTPAVTTASTITPGSTYTVKKGDTLRKLAKLAYGDEDLWRIIFRANRQNMDAADDLQVGEKIKIPVKP